MFLGKCIAGADGAQELIEKQVVLAKMWLELLDQGKERPREPLSMTTEEWYTLSCTDMDYYHKLLTRRPGIQAADDSSCHLALRVMKHRAKQRPLTCGAAADALASSRCATPPLILLSHSPTSCRATGR